MAERNKHRFSRRSVIQIVGGVGGVGAAGAVGAVAVSLSGGDSADAAQTGASAAPGEAAGKRAFVHPGMLHDRGDLNRAKVRVAAKKSPWPAGWQRLTVNRNSASTWKANPQAAIIRGGEGQNCGILFNDIHAAYQNALCWKIAGTDSTALWSTSRRARATARSRTPSPSCTRTGGWPSGRSPAVTRVTGTRGDWREQTVISNIGRGYMRPVWELLYNHHARRRRLSAPHVTAMAEKVRSEGGGGDYGPNSGGFDQLGFGTLLYSK